MDFAEEIKPKILSVLRFTIALCQKHGLRYYACGGTMLGAVRHGNIIPWDDDIDIYMPRPDYERFLDLKASLSGSGIDIVSLRDKDYPIPFAKIMDTQSTIWEQEEYPYLVGAYVDVFPLDYYEGSDEAITAHMYKCKKYFSRYYNTLCAKPFTYSSKLWREGQHVPAMTSLVYALLLRPFRSFFLQKFNELCLAKTVEGGSRCVCNTQWEGRIFRSEWFEDCIEMPFADMTIPVPRQYDKYLTLLYGNYMQLPPEHQRVTNHPTVFYDLHHRLSLQEVKAMLRKQHG